MGLFGVRPRIRAKKRAKKEGIQLKVIIEQKAGADYPAALKHDKVFLERQAQIIRIRLQLGPSDIVEIKEVET